ncbi:hypothetical protein [Microbacterium sp. nov. GSS16]|uniref:hypothetical protein n=1 Tax=Microbacterium sp. nov. GSS16 TaxID=3019890 RepID=UPI002305ABFA|nr:hypothetical protein [Microbacterium sp. nov. GSS16]WCD91465.1 hypothetical protein PGB26_07045 [Microbacterium sp. nov. GSS16]
MAVVEYTEYLPKAARVPSGPFGPQVAAGRQVWPDLRLDEIEAAVAARARRSSGREAFMV